MFADLWQAALREAAARDLARPSARHQIVRTAARGALDCVAASTLMDNEALQAGSCSLLASLTLLWAAAEIEPDEIWMELHKRERLGMLLHEMAHGQDKPKRQQVRPWRVDSTKLP